jgi:uncharacterized membrane protein
VFFLRKNVRYLTHGAILAAAYAALAHLQNLLLPGSASMAIQFRVAEALCVLAFLTPAAVPGLTVGCFLFNVTSGAALPMDFLVGSFATFLATGCMWKLRRFPWLGAMMPALWNALLVGWELAVCIGGGFWINALYVAIGEVAVLYVLGMPLYHAVKKHGRLFLTKN